jgi:osmotically-inducible protein OsmY
MNEQQTSGGYAYELWMADDELKHVQPELEEALADAQVHVMTETHDGVAMLWGTVGTYAEKLAAREAVKSVPGIWRIEDKIVVEPSRVAQQVVDDTTLRHRIEMALAWDSRLHGGVTVAVDDGRVTLGGTVRADAERDAVLDVVGRLHGVRGIVNEIAVMPVPQPLHIEERVEEAIKHVLGRDARHVHVVVTEEEIDLRGWVRTLAQSEAAERAVRRLMGDTPLANSLRVKH